MSQGEFWSNHPLEYVPPDTAAPKPEVSRQFEHPEDWVKEINPDQRAPGRNNNCGDCARATELTWRGVPAVSAAYAYPESGGESDDRMEEWSRQYLAPASFTAIQEKLEKAGAGSSALVAVGWDGGGGHWFNAVNHGGEVLAVDGQRNTVEKWPPTRSVTGYDESRTVESLAILFDKSGNMI